VFWEMVDFVGEEVRGKPVGSCGKLSGSLVAGGHTFLFPSLIPLLSYLTG